MRILMRIVILLVMFFATVAAFFGEGLAFFEFVIAIYGGIFLLLLDKAFNFLKQKL